MGILTDGDRELLPRILRQNGGFGLGTEWYLRGFKPLPYQYNYHQARIGNTTWLAGVAGGKTVGSAASCTMDCISIPYFKVLNTSVTAKQSELPFDQFMSWYEGNDKLEHLVEDVKLRPWPIVKFKNFSLYEFRTSGTNARFIRGTEFDRIVFDECGLDYNGEIVKVLRSRLRGIRPDGSKRMARLDCISSPTDAPWFRERYERGLETEEIYDPAYYRSFKTRTRENTNLTEEQIRLMEAEFTDEELAVEMDAEFPDYGMSFFPKSHINACTSLDLLSMGQDAVEAQTKGWVIEEHFRHGIVKWEMPYDPEAYYVMAGDPGKDDPPRRNSGCIGVLDISKTPAQLVYFHWTAGHGSINPFMESYYYAINKYNPIVKMVDNTGPQSGTQEIGFTNIGIETDGINFNSKKNAALNHLSYNITNHEIEWPIIKGLVKQTASYTMDNDKKDDFPQDIVMMMGMLALGLRFKDIEPDSKPGRKAHRVSRKRRTSVARRR